MSVLVSEGMRYSGISLLMIFDTVYDTARPTCARGRRALGTLLSLRAAIYVYRVSDRVNKSVADAVVHELLDVVGKHAMERCPCV